MAGITLWMTHAEGYGQWIANRILFGFFGSPSFAMVEVSISDVVRPAPFTLIITLTRCRLVLPA